MRISRRGAKDNRVRLVWSKYFKYILQEQEYYIKQKAYATYCDGWFQWDLIAKQTYNKAIARGCKVNEIIVEEDILEVPTQVLTLIFNETYKLKESNVREAICKAEDALKKIRLQSNINYVNEYKVFKRVTEFHLDTIKERGKEKEVAI